MQHVTVSLSGDGGDELFGGYTRYPFVKLVWNILRRVPSPAARAAAKVIRSVPPATMDRWIGMLPFLPGWIKRSPGDKFYKLAGLLAARDPAVTYLHTLSHWPDPMTVVPGSREPATVLQAIIDLKWLPTAEERAMLTDLTNYLPDDILTKVDRASMAIGLEARVPILDHRVVEFAWRLPLRFKMRDGKMKWILKQVLYRYVPPDLVERPKMGFGVPVDLWLRGPLRAWAEELLSPRTLTRNGFFNADPIRQKWEEHVSGKRNWDYQLWNVLVFQEWFSAHASQPQAVAAYNHGEVS